MLAQPGSDDSPCLEIIRLLTPGATLAQFLNFAINQRLPVSYESLRMSHFTCNAPNITGYSGLSAWGDTVTIKTHASNTDFCYQECNSKTDIWVYMPIDGDEFVTAILTRLRIVHGSYMNIALIVSNTVFTMRLLAY